MRERAVHRYQRALDRLRRAGSEPGLLERMEELVSLLEVTTTLGAAPADEGAWSAALLIVARRLRAPRAAFFVRNDEGALVLRASRGLPSGAPPILDLAGSLDGVTTPGPNDDVRERHGLEVLVPIRRRDHLIAVLGMGPRRGGRAYGSEERAFLRLVAASAAAPTENGLIDGDLRRVHQSLSVKAFELHNLFDISRELSVSFEEKAVYDLVATSIMGHFLVSRCALYLLGPKGLALVHQRGLREEDASEPIPPEDVRATLEGLVEPKTIGEMPEGSLRRRLERSRLALAVPLASGTRVEGVLAIGERASGTPFSAEDRGFARTLGLQTLAALENARLLRLRAEKQRQDRELQIAREIQRGLFPARPPEVTGFEVAAESRPCYEVGGDAYDWVDLGGERLAIVVADVSGKGTPASLLMASVHAFVRALAGTAPPALVVERLNRFLFASTPPSRFVTLFYAELDAASRRLAYVNAGHVPPYRVAADGTTSRLVDGGPALGLLDEASYDAGEIRLQPGEAVAVVTDGVTEANSPDDREFGDDRVWGVLRTGGSAPSLLARLLSAVNEWAGSVGCGDDLTALVLKAR
jgi:sigma-B regulation protein RsbU (phosphoserine phosphatase)